MTDRDEPGLEERVQRLEERIEAVLRAVESLREAAPGSSRPPPPEPPPPFIPPPPPPREGPRIRERTPALSLGSLTAGGSGLGKLGIGLLLLGVAFLFRYSIDQGWLVPPVRVAFGFALGAGLVVLGLRRRGLKEPLPSLLQGGGVATLFIAGFATYELYALVPYGVGFLLMALSAMLAFGLSLRGGDQALAIVGVVGALLTPFILSSPSTNPTALTVYVSALVAAVAAIYIARGWRDQLWVAFVGVWMSFTALTADQMGRPGRTVVAVGLAFALVAFWLVPLGRAVLWAADPGSWPRPSRRPPSKPGGWATHVHALSVLTLPMAVGLTGALFELPREGFGWLFLVAAAAARGVGWIVEKADAGEGHGATQSLVAIMLTTVALALLLTGAWLYAALVAEAVVLHVLGHRRDSRVLVGFGQALGAAVTLWFVARLAADGWLMGPEGAVVVDVGLLAGAFWVSRYQTGGPRAAYRVGAYAGLLLLLRRELLPLALGEALVTVTWGGIGLALVLFGLRGGGRTAVRTTGLVTLLVVVAKLFLVDLATVSPLWRTLLFMAFGGVFLVLSKLFQEEREGARD
ncbi:MAG TPA: DUF2339 domain-containing protein [Longimicrobiales bacterium]